MALGGSDVILFLEMSERMGEEEEDEERDGWVTDDCALLTS